MPKDVSTPMKQRVVSDPLARARRVPSTPVTPNKRTTQPDEGGSSRKVSYTRQFMELLCHQCVKKIDDQALHDVHMENHMLGHNVPCRYPSCPELFMDAISEHYHSRSCEERAPERARFASVISPSKDKITVIQLRNQAETAYQTGIAPLNYSASPAATGSSGSPVRRKPRNSGPAS